MTNERLFIEINNDNSVYDGKTLKVTVPAESQSQTGVDFYMTPEFTKDKNLVVESVSISPAPLHCYWNWLLSTWGTPEYETTPSACKTIDISKYQMSGIQGTFGFSGHTENDSDIVITFKIASDNT